jgi:hypothetical protein
VLPLTAVTHYLNVSVVADIAGQAQTRSLMVPIRLQGGEARKAAIDPAERTEGQVQSLEAVELVR